MANRFQEILSSVLDENLLDKPISQCSDLVQEVLSLISQENVNQIYQVLIREHQRLKTEQPYWYPQRLTLGSFFFGCYLDNSNKYCSDMCALSLPNFLDQNQVCYNPVVVFDNNSSTQLPGYGAVCQVHISPSSDPSRLSEHQVEQLRELNCSEIEVYQNGSLVINGTPNNYQSVVNSTNQYWSFPDPDPPGYEVVVTNVQSVPVLVDNGLQNEPMSPIPNSLAIGIALMLIIIFIGMTWYYIAFH